MKGMHYETIIDLLLSPKDSLSLKWLHQDKSHYLPP